jgi:outer membrane protein
MKNIIYKYLLLISFFCATFTVFGQGKADDTPYTLTLQECIDAAIKNNVQVKQSGLQVIGSKVAVDQAKAERWPSVNGSMGYSYNIGRSINPFTNLYEENPISSQNYGLNANVNLFNGLRIHNTVQKNQVDLEVSQYDLETVKNNITLDVISAYTQLLFNRELLGNARFQLENTNLQLERTRKLVEAGSLPVANTLELEAQQASGEADIVNAENNLALAELQLKQLMQMPASSTLEVVVPEVEVPATESLVMSAEGVYETDLEAQPSIKSVEAQISSAEYNVAIARSGYYPSLFLSGSLSTAYYSVAPVIITRGGAENVTQIVPTG